jgi:hypothetical protein
VSRRRPRDPVAREERRLRQLFRSILVAVASPGLTACSEAPSAGAADSAAPAQDASPAVDASVANPSDADVPGDSAAGDADCSAIAKLGCAPLLYPDAAYVDLTLDAEICPMLLPCGIPANTVVSGCDLEDEGGNQIGCRIADGGECQQGVYRPAACGQVDLECRCDLFVGGGRRAGARPGRRRQGRAWDPVGAYFARMAFEEAASVTAFRRLRAELEAHGAPTSLVDRAARSERDETRHARTMARTARRCGATPARVSRSARRRVPRSLEAVARENAAEGCVRETFGALLAAWQASHARAPATRRLMTQIAADEMRHAALAWAVAEWAEERLDAPSRNRVRSARMRALYSLGREIERPVDAALVRVVGLPTPREAKALLRALEARLLGEDSFDVRSTGTGPGPTGWTT